MPFSLIAATIMSSRKWEEIQVQELGASALSSLDRWYRIDLRNNPTYVILDSGCTRSMGSKTKVMLFIAFCVEHCPWIKFKWIWQPVKFSFANSHSNWVNWTVLINYHFEDGTTFTIPVSVLEEGDVPILLSNQMMGTLHLDIINREECTFINCPCLGMFRAPAELSTTNHQVIDLSTLVSSPGSGEKSASAEFLSVLAATAPADVEQWYDVEQKATEVLRTFTSIPYAYKGDEEQLYEPEGPEAVEVGPEDLSPEQVDKDLADPAMSSRAPPRLVPKVKASELDLSLKRIHEKLRDPTELFKLHLKHYHMSLEQFKLRTTQLQIPKEIYDLYEKVITKCHTCAKTSPTPARSRVSGMRSEIFGDLLFMDYADFEIENKNIKFLLILDAATTLLCCYPVQDDQADTGISCLRKMMKDLHLKPKSVCADNAFMSENWEKFYNYHNINPINLGPKTPWPNRAEAAVRTFKRYLKMFVNEIKDRVTLRLSALVTPELLLSEACWARNITHTYGGKTPLELAFGRRPPDIMSWENATLGQLTNEPAEADKIINEIRTEAMRAYLKARQAEDIRNDIASSLKFVKGPFSEGDKVWYWHSQKDKKLPDKGHWLQATVRSVKPPMALIDLGTRTINVNQSLLRGDKDRFSNIDVPLSPIKQDDSGENIDYPPTFQVWKNPRRKSNRFELPKASGGNSFPPGIDACFRRITRNANGEVIADEDLRKIANNKFQELLPDPTTIKTEFYYVPLDEPLPRRPKAPAKPGQPIKPPAAPAAPKAKVTPKKKSKTRKKDPAAPAAPSSELPVAPDGDAPLIDYTVHNLLNESIEDLTTFDEQTTFDRVLWQCEMKGKINLLELFAGSARISQCAAVAGLSVGQPIDLRTGFDLLSKAGQKKVIEILMMQEPDCVWMAPLCSPWSQWSNMKPDDVKYADREAVMPMVRFCVQVAKHQISRGKYFVIENPKDSAIWFTRIFQELLRKEGVTYGDLDFCAFGMTDPANNLYYRKSTSLLHNMPPSAVTPLFKLCPNKTGGRSHEHQPVEGSAPGYGQRSKISQVYPYRFCKLFADVLRLFLRKPARDVSTFLIEDILDLTFNHDDSLEAVAALANLQDIEGDISTALSTTIRVTDQNTKDLINAVNALPTKTELLLHKLPDSAIAQKMTPLCLELRRRYLPNHVFDCCSILRGTLGTQKPADLVTSSEAFLFVWYKGSAHKEILVYNASSEWETISQLPVSKVSAVMMWLGGGSSGSYKPPLRPVLSKNPFSTDGIPPTPPGLDKPKLPIANPQDPIFLTPTPTQQQQLNNLLPQQHPIVPSTQPAASSSNGLGGESQQQAIKNDTEMDQHMHVPVPDTPPITPELAPQNNTPTKKTHLKPIPTARKAKPKPPSPPPVPSGTRSTSPTPRVERSRSRDDDNRQGERGRRKERSKSRDDAPASPPRGSRSRSRDRSKSHDDDDRSPPPGSRSHDDTDRDDDDGEEYQPTDQGGNRSSSSSSKPSRSSRSSLNDRPHKAVRREDRSKSRDDDQDDRDDAPLRNASRSRDNSPEDQGIVPSDEEDLPQDAPTRSGPMRVRIHSDPEYEEDSEESENTEDPSVDPSSFLQTYLEAEEPDMIYDPETSDWNRYTEMDKEACVTGNFSFVRNCDRDILSLESYIPSRRVCESFLVAPATKNSNTDIFEQMPGITNEDKAMLSLCFDARGQLYSGFKAAPTPTSAKIKKRKEASSQDKRDYSKEFWEAKQKEIQSWIDNEVYELADVRKLSKEQRRNFVTGRWVLTIKRTKDGHFDKCKARWVLRGFLDKQKGEQQTDSPAASRPGFRLAASAAANNRWDLFHMDLKTAFLQGESYDDSRKVICELPKEAGHPWYMVAVMKKPAYGLNDAPRRWWNIIDEALRSYGCVPTRADRCTYVLYHDDVSSSGAPLRRPRKHESNSNDHPPTPLSVMKTLEDAVEYLMDPVTGSNCKGRKVAGTVCLHVDDLFMSGNDYFQKQVMASIRRDFQVGSEDKNDIMFVGQRIRWVGKGDASALQASPSAPAGKKSVSKPNKPAHICVDQKVAVDELEEVKFDKSLKDNVECDSILHTAYRSVLGQVNWLQSRTQFHSCYKFSRAASAASKPTIAHVRELNKLVRQVKSATVTMNFWPLNGKLRFVGIPDASYKNNEDKSSQRAHVIFLAEERSANAPASVKGTLVDYESHKISVTTQSTTVAELHAFMKCFGTCLFLKGLWADISGEDSQIHMRTDANNLVTTAKTTHAPEQKETIHLIQMLRKESTSGKIDDLAHVSSADCLSDALTKHSAKPDALLQAVDTGRLHNIDVHPPFRTLLRHKAFFLGTWISKFVQNPLEVVTFLAEDVVEMVHKAYYSL